MSILTGDCLTLLGGMAAHSVQCCVTSPPYYGLRDYGHDGQIGLEQTPEEYVGRLVAVFREVRRLLRDDGVLWVNLGDSYAGGGCGARDPERWPKQHRNDHMARHRKTYTGLPFKSLIGIPWRFAFAMQEDGWILRQDIVWSKPNPMPESVTDRCTKAHEYIFMFAKRSNYYFDHEAMREPAVSEHPSGNGFKRAARRSFQNADGSARGSDTAWTAVGGTRNRRSVWTVTTKPFKGAHFATFPADLIEPCIASSSRIGDIVLDPFGGAGTTGLVADRLGREFVLCEINPEYTTIAGDRIREDRNKRKERDAARHPDLFEEGVAA